MRQSGSRPFLERRGRKMASVRDFGWDEQNKVCGWSQVVGWLRVGLWMGGSCFCRVSRGLAGHLPTNPLPEQAFCAARSGLRFDSCPLMSHCSSRALCTTQSIRQKRSRNGEQPLSFGGRHRRRRVAIVMAGNGNKGGGRQNGMMALLGPQYRPLLMPVLGCRRREEEKKTASARLDYVCGWISVVYCGSFVGDLVAMPGVRTVRERTRNSAATRVSLRWDFSIEDPVTCCRPTPPYRSWPRRAGKTFVKTFQLPSIPRRIHKTSPLTGPGEPRPTASA